MRHLNTSGRWLVLIPLLFLAGCQERVFEVHRQSPLQWQELRGQWVFINYWAQWCQPCRKEMPELNDFARQHKSVRVLGVNFDRPAPEQLDAQIEALGVQFPVLLDDPAAVLGYEAPKVLPATYVFDPQGNYLGVMVGPQTRESLAMWLRKDQQQISLNGAGGRP